MSRKRCGALSERMVRSIYLMMQNGIDTERLAIELGVSKASARRYTKFLTDARLVVRKDSSAGSRFFMSSLDLFAIFKVEKDFVRITVCSFAKKYIVSVVIPYNEALIPEHTVKRCNQVLMGICEELCGERVFAGAVMCDNACIDNELCKGLCSDITLSEQECELWGLEREKERDQAFTEYLCGSVRRSRMSDRIIDSWRSMDISERGMIEALFCLSVERARGGELI